MEIIGRLIPDPPGCGPGAWLRPRPSKTSDQLRRIWRWEAATKIGSRVGRERGRAASCPMLYHHFSCSQFLGKSGFLLGRKSWRLAMYFKFAVIASVQASFSRSSRSINSKWYDRGPSNPPRLFFLPSALSTMGTSSTLRQRTTKSTEKANLVKITNEGEEMDKQLDKHDAYV